MKFLYTLRTLWLAVLFCLPLLASAQYTLNPASKIKTSITWESNFTSDTIYFTNTTANEYKLEWEINKFTHDTSWETSFCDNVTCYFDIPSNSITADIAPNETIPLIFDVTPHGSTSIDTFQVVFNIEGEPNTTDTLTWITHTTLASIGSAPSVVTVQLYPNPATEVINVSVPKFSKGSFVVVTDMQGRSLHREQLRNQRQQLSVSMLPAGLYLIYVENKDSRSGATMFEKK